MKATTEQIRHIRFLLGKGKMNEDVKCDLAMQFSNDRTTSLSALTKEEAMQLIEALRLAVLPPEELKADEIRKSILQIVWQLGWQKDGKVDMVRVNAFIHARGCSREGKVNLNSYSNTELVGLRNQFISMHKNTIKRL